MPKLDPDVRAILFDGYVRELGSLTRRMREAGAPAGSPEAALTDLAEGLNAACMAYLRARRAEHSGERESLHAWHVRLLKGVRWRRS